MNELQEEGIEILKEKNLIEKLSSFGEVHLVGNIAFATTIKPDIDIQIYPNDKFEEITSRIEKTFEESGIGDVIIRKLRQSKKTLILGKLKYNDKIWNIDIALTNKSNNYIYDSYKYYLDNKDIMTEEKRDIIIKLKRKFCQNKIVFDNPSYYIYKGVLDENVSTEEEMKAYLKIVEEGIKKEKNK